MNHRQIHIEQRPIERVGAWPFDLHRVTFDKRFRKLLKPSMVTVLKTWRFEHLSIVNVTHAPVRQRKGRCDTWQIL